MANELVFSGDPNIDTGLTVTASVYTHAGLLVQAGIACTESGTSAIYSGDMPTTGSGVYVVQFFSGDDFLGAGEITWDGQSSTPSGTAPLPSAIPTSTAQDIIESALRLLQVLGDDVVLTAKEGQDALRAMQYMMDSWGIESGFINMVKMETFTLTPGHNPHTWGIGGDFNSTRPNKILSAKIRTAQGVDFDVSNIAYDDYAAIRLKTLSTAYPQYLYCDFATGMANIYLYPVPSTALPLLVFSEKPLDVPLTLNTVLSLPPGYYRALKYNLAVELAPEYQVTAGQDVILLAKESLANVKRQNIRLTSLQVDLALLNSGGRRYNIYRDG